MIVFKIGSIRCFNPRTYIRYDPLEVSRFFIFNWFQSTYLYKVRPLQILLLSGGRRFNPRTYIRYDLSSQEKKRK